ncbi:MAG: CHAT domain-containing protein [Myxococcota bacterium]|nr:CHAT domain-containing protein [Myxococcota bacterium]
MKRLLRHPGLFSCALLSLLACSPTSRHGTGLTHPPTRHSFYFTAAPVAVGPFDEFQPTASPSSRDIIYVSEQGGNQDIFRVSSTQPTPLRLTTHSADDSEPHLSPSGDQILWISKSDDVKGDVWLMDLDGGGKRRLTDRTSAERTPIWHPHLAQILFTTRAVGQPFEQIELLDLTTGERKVVVERGYDPAISPDGALLFFVKLDRHFQPRIYAHHLHTQEVVPLTDGTYAAGMPFTPTSPAPASNSSPLFFARFLDDENRDGQVTLNDGPSLWTMEVPHTVFKTGLLPTPHPLTTSRPGQFLAAVSDHHLFYTAEGPSDLDIYALPRNGSIPRDIAPEALLTAIKNEPDAQRRRLALRHILSHHQASESEARYALARELLEETNFKGALRELKVVIEGDAAAPLKSIATLQSMRILLVEALGPRLNIQNDEQRQLVLKLTHRLHALPLAQDAARGRAKLLQAELQIAGGERKAAVESLEQLSNDTSFAAEDRAMALERLAELYSRMQRLEDIERVTLKLLSPALGDERFIIQRSIQRWVEAASSLSEESPLAALERISSHFAHLPALASRALARLATLQQAQGHHEIALVQWRSLIQNYPEQRELHARALRESAALAMRGGDITGAMEAYQQLIREYPRDASIHEEARRGMISIALREARQAEAARNPQEAYRLYAALLQTNRSLVQAHRNLIRLASRLGKLPKHLMEYRRWSLRQPRNALARYSYGYALTFSSERGVLQQAEKEVSASLGIDPRFAPAHLTLGWIREQMEKQAPQKGHLERAIQSYQASRDLLLAGEDTALLAASHLNLGNAFFRLGKSDSAFNAYLQREHSDEPFQNPKTELFFRLHFARAAIQLQVYDVALDQILLAHHLNKTFKRKEFTGPISAVAAAAHFQAGLHNDALPWFNQAYEYYKSEVHWDQAIPLLRGKALSLMYTQQTARARASFNELLHHLKAGHTPKAGADSFFAIVAQVPADANNITQGPFGFSSQHEFAIGLGKLAALHLKTGHLTTAATFLRQQLAMIRNLQSDAPHAISLTPELVDSLHNNALLHAQLNQHASAYRLWTEVLNQPLPLSSSQLSAIIQSILYASHDAPPPDTLLGLIGQKTRPLLAPTIEDASPPSPKLLRLTAFYHLYLLGRPTPPTPLTSTQDLQKVLHTLDRRVYHLNQAKRFAEVAEDPALVAQLSFLQELSLSSSPLVPPLETLTDWSEAFEWYSIIRLHAAAPSQPFLERAVHLFMEAPWPTHLRESQAFARQAATTLLASGQQDRAWALLEKFRLLQWSPSPAKVPPMVEAAWGPLRQLRSTPERHRAYALKASWLTRSLEGSTPTLKSFQAALPTQTLFVQAFPLNAKEWVWFLISRSEFRVLRSVGVHNNNLPTKVVQALRSKAQDAYTAHYFDLGERLPNDVNAHTLTETIKSSPLAVSEVLSATYLLATLESRQFPTLETRTWASHASPPGQLPEGRHQWLLLNIDLPETLSTTIRPGLTSPLVRFTKKGTTRSAPLGEFIGSRFNSQGAIFGALPPSAVTRRSLAQTMLLQGTTRMIFAPETSSKTIARLQKLETESSSAKALATLNREASPSARMTYAGDIGDTPVQEVLLATEKLLELAQQTGKHYRAATAAAAKNQPANWESTTTLVQKLLNVIDFLQRSENLNILRRAANLFPPSTPPRIVQTATRLPALLNNLSLSNRDRLAQLKALQGDLPTALKLQQSVVTAYREAGDTEKEGRALATLGKAYYRARSLPGAARAFEDCIKVARKGEHNEVEADCSSRLGSVLRDRYDYASARVHYNRAQRLYEKLKHPDQLYPLRYLGFLFESSLHDYDGALEQFNQALSIARAHSRHAIIPRLYLDIARVHRQKGSYITAIATTREVLTMKGQNDPGVRGEALLELARDYWYLGDYAQARENQKKALDLAIKSAKAFLEIQAMSLAGLIDLNEGKFRQAEQKVQTALKLSQRTRRLSEVATQLNNLGTIYRASKRWAEAEDAFNQALQLDIRLENQEGQAFDLRNLGIYFAQRKQFSKARETLEKALQLSRKLGNKYNELQTLFGLAEVYEEERDNRSLETWQDTRRLARRLWNREILWRSHYGLGRHFLLQGDSASAQSWFNRALPLAEKLGHQRAAINTPYSRLRLYGDLANLAFEASSSEDVFHYTERAKGRKVLDTLIGVSLKPTSPGARLLLEEEAKAQRRLMEAQRSRVPAEISAQMERHQKIESELLATHPLLARTQIISPISAERLQERLGENTLVISYALLDSFQAALLISRDNMEVVPLNVDLPQLTKEVLDLTRRMSSFAPTEDLLQKLSAHLISPLTPHLQGKSHVIVIPDGPITMVPFVALPYAEGALIDSFTLSYELSATHLYERLGTPAPASPTSVLALAPATDLPFSYLEAHSLENAQVYTGYDATYRRVLSGQADALAIGAHGRLSANAPLANGLLLWSDHEPPQPQLLSTRQIFQLHDLPSLVTLSACHAWDGDARQEGDIGNAWLSMANAFSVAGAQTVVASQGRVSDLAAAVLMKRFYRNLKTLPRAEALREAALVVRRYYRHPSHWASFALMGDPR